MLVDAFAKFMWIYPTKSRTTAEVIKRLKERQKVFGNPKRFISNRRTAFTSDEFSQYCEKEGTQHCRITTGTLQSNGQIEWVNGIVEDVLRKLDTEEEGKCYKSPAGAQRVLSAVYCKNTIWNHVRSQNKVTR